MDAPREIVRLARMRGGQPGDHVPPRFARLSTAKLAEESGSTGAAMKKRNAPAEGAHAPFRRCVRVLPGLRGLAHGQRFFDFARGRLRATVEEKQSRRSDEQGDENAPSTSADRFQKDQNLVHGLSLLSGFTVRF